ncbi:MAG: YraN family protein [Myxococcales bacterium]|nr:YraN family protein [Myxococcales bacterium]
MALLRSKGFSIVHTNFVCEQGELDIVARDGDELVFVEVRSRADDEHGDALDAIGPRKQKQVARVAQAYISIERPIFVTSRFDVVAQTGAELVHLVDAFRPHGP